MTRLYIKLFLFIVLVFLFTIVFLFNQFQAYPAEVDYFDDHIDAAFDSRHRAKHLNIVPHPSTRLSHLSVSLSSDSLSQKIRSPNRGAAIRANRHRKKQQPRTQLEQPLEPGEIRSRKPNVPPRLLTLSAEKSSSHSETTISFKLPPSSSKRTNLSSLPQFPTIILKQSYPKHSSKHSLSRSKFTKIPQKSSNSSSLLSSKANEFQSKSPFSQSISSNSSSSASVQQIQFSEHLFVFSSFVDKRNGNMDYACIRAGVVKYAYREARYWCKLDLVSDGGDKQIQIEASLYELAENHSQLYGTFILSCCCCSSNARVYSRSNTSSSDQHHPAGNSDLDLDKIYEWTLTDGIHESRIPITYRIPAQTPIGTYSVEYAVCVPYLFGTVYSKERLVEFFELNRLLGVERVNIYAHKDALPDQVRQTIEYYATTGLLELVEYTPPVEDIWYHGQLITITDCLYRNIGVTRYLSFHDLDEFIIPIKHDNLLDLYNEIFNESIASYRIPSRRFLIENETLITVNNVKSQPRLDNRFTKCVLRPEMVFEQGIHHTSRVIQDHYKMPYMSPDDAILHHYKKDIANITSITSITSNHAQRFSARLNRTYQRTLQKIDQIN